MYTYGLPLPSPGEFANPRIETAFPALAEVFFTAELPGKPIFTYACTYIYILGVYKTRCQEHKVHIHVIMKFFPYVILKESFERLILETYALMTFYFSYL